MRRKILHISHTDLDGYIPVMLNKMIVTLCDDVDKSVIIPEHEYESMHINPPELIEILSDNEFIQKYDTIIITDLRISGDVLLKIIEYGLEKFYIADHHPIDYDLEASIKSFEKYKSWNTEDITEHIVLSETLGIGVNNQLEEEIRKTCGTELYWELFLYKWLKEMHFIFRENYRFISNIRRIVNATRAWDTYDWKNLTPNSMDRITAERLQILFSTISKDDLLNYLIDYMYLGDNYSFTYDINTSPFSIDIEKRCKLPIAYIINSEIDKKNKYIEKMTNPNNKNYQMFTWSINTPNYKDTLNAALIFSNRYASDIGYDILEQESDIDIVIIISNRSVQLRSLDHLADCGKIAKLYGGGGHHNAAGFIPLTQDVLWMERNFFLGLCNLCSDIKRPED